MLVFKSFDKENITDLREFYAACDYRLCEYSVGVKLMWRDYLHSSWCEVAGCLVICNVIEGRTQFDFPIPGIDGDVDAALTAIEKYCTESGLRPVISVVPRERATELILRYPKLKLLNERPWQDYLYRAEDLMTFAGRKYSGQRNHINRFKKLYPNAAFRPLTADDRVLLQQFWQDYALEFRKETKLAIRELEEAQGLFSLMDSGAFRVGGIELEGRLIAVCLAEKCGNTLVDHIEKALYSYEGIYPALVQAFAAHYAGDCQWINREDDARDKGLRMSKRQYLPAAMGEKLYCEVGSLLDALTEVPSLETERLRLNALSEDDGSVYNALCLDDERNRWWGYDYRKDCHGEPDEGYFLQVARQDFAAHNAVNWAIRLDGRCIGEVVLYNQDWRGGMELGCRIVPEAAGHGYGTEAFAAAADWALYSLGLSKVAAKCYKENTASLQMLSSCMRESGEDETFFYFEKYE